MKLILSTMILAALLSVIASSQSFAYGRLNDRADGNAAKKRLLKTEFGTIDVAALESVLMYRHSTYGSPAHIEIKEIGKTWNLLERGADAIKSETERFNVHFKSSANGVDSSVKCRLILFKSSRDQIVDDAIFTSCFDDKNKRFANTGRIPFAAFMLTDGQ